MRVYPGMSFLERKDPRQRDHRVARHFMNTHFPAESKERRRAPYRVAFRAMYYLVQHAREQGFALLPRLGGVELNAHGRVALFAVTDASVPEFEDRVYGYLDGFAMGAMRGVE